MRAWILLLGVLLAAGAQAQERVTSFHSFVEIDVKGVLTVTETIEVQAEGQQIKRGILRDFPTDYHDRFGRLVTVPFEVLSVNRNGRGEPFSEFRKANGVSLRIGNASVLLPRGPQVYEIRYRTRYQVGFFDAHDELYWNVNGNGWTFAMDSISAAVALPAPVPAADLKVEAYTGGFGARGREYDAQARAGGAEFRTRRPMAAGEGLTIVVMFPKGVVTPPTLREKFDRWLADNRGEAYGAVGLLLMIVFLYWRWAAVGRDPRSGPVYPRYEAPAGLGPAGTRYLDQMEFDDRGFAAALLGLAQRGYLRIQENGGGYVLTRTGKAVDWLPGEAAVARLSSEGEAREIGRSYDPAVQQARAAAAMSLQKYFGAKYFTKNTGSLVAGFIIGALALFVMFILDAVFFAMGTAILVIFAALMLAWKLMPAYTVEGRRLQDEVEGLRQYLSVAEKDDLARQKRPPRTPEEFAKFLPYAVALGVEKTWADAFTAVLGASALAAATADYYSSSSPDSFSSSTGNFAGSIASLGDTISAASTPPGSSSGGSSGGGSSSSSSSSSGSSGGGGGGGGGSGW